MVRSTVADSIIGTLQGIAAAPRNLASTRAQEQQNEVNQQGLDLLQDTDLIAEIEQAGNYRINPTDTSGALFQYDMMSLYKNRPDLALRIFNSDPRFNVATDEKGRRFQTEITRFVDNEDGSISALVRRTDGREAPLTRNRTAQGDDIVEKISLEDFNKIGSSITGSMVARGAGNNAATFLRDAASYTSAMLANAAADKAANSDMADDPAAMSRFYAMINRASPEELKAIAADLNIDVPAVQAQAEAAIAQQTQGQSGGGADTDVDMSVADDQFYSGDQPQATQQAAAPWSIDSVNRDTRSGRLIAQAEGLTSKVVGGLAVRKEEDPLASLEKYKQELEKRIAATEASRASLNTPLDIPPEKDRLLKDKAELEQINSYMNRDSVPTQAQPVATEQKQPPVVAADLESNIEPPSQSVFDRQGLIQTIRERTAEPTEAQVEAMSRYLQKKGVGTAQDLSNLPIKDAHMAVWVAASRQPGSVSERLAVAQNLLNYINTGSLSVDPAQAANVRARQSENRLARDKYITELQTAYNTDVGAAADLLFKVREALINENGDFELTSDNEAAAANEVNKVWTLYTNSLEGSPKRAAYANIAMEAVLSHMLAKSNSSKPGLFEVAKKLDNWKNSDGQLRIGKNAIAGLVRETPDGFEFVNPSREGSKLNFTIPKGAIKRMYGDDVFSAIQELARANASNSNTGG